MTNEKVTISAEVKLLLKARDIEPRDFFVFCAKSDTIKNIYLECKERFRVKEFK